MKLKHPKDNKLILGQTPVAVDWEDAWSNSTRYFNLRSIAEEAPVMMRTVGILIQNDKRGVAVANDYSPDLSTCDYRHCHFIPRKMVHKVTKLS